MAWGLRGAPERGEGPTGRAFESRGGREGGVRSAESGNFRTRGEAWGAWGRKWRC